MLINQPPGEGGPQRTMNGDVRMALDKAINEVTLGEAALGQHSEEFAQR